MSKYIETSTRKMVGAFAGVGALVEDIKGVILIESLEKWPFINNITDKSEYHMNDKRLLDRLKNDKGFPEIKYLVRMPPNTTKQFTSGPYTQPQDGNDIATGHYFPEWMYCNKCNGFNSLYNWYDKWEKVIDQYDPKNSKNVRNNFIPPKCGYCYGDDLKNSKKNSKKYLNPEWYELTQVRFIMTSSDGGIVDLPWEKWITFKNEKFRSFIKGDLTMDEINNYQPCCDRQDLSYIQKEQGDFSSIIIKCRNQNCKQQGTLEGIFGFSFFNDKDREYKYKTVIRSSNSVYYPILMHSIYLPNITSISDADQLQINEWLKDPDYDINTIYLSLSKRYSKDQIKAYQDSLNVNSTQKEVDYRRNEYQFILDNPVHDKNDFIFSHQSTKPIEKNIITNLTKVSRLKMTSIQTGYSRQEPLDVDLFLSGEVNRIKPKYTTNKNKNTQYLLGVENYGEGIFIALDNEPIDKYISKYSETLNEIFMKAQNSSLFENKFINSNHLGRYIFVHTISHLLMKELEFSILIKQKD